MFRLLLRSKVDNKSTEMVQYEHFVLHKNLINVLEVVFGGYELEKNKFVPPNAYLFEIFQKLLFRYRKITNAPNFQNLAIIDLGIFTSLDDKQNSKLWVKLKKQILLDNRFLKSKISNKFYLPIEIANTIYIMRSLAEDHKVEKAKLLGGYLDITPLPNYFKWNGDKFYISETKYFEIRSFRKQIFKSFTDANGDWVAIKSIHNDTNKKESEIRTIINQINERIVEKGFNKIMLLEHSGHGSYKLSVFNVNP